MIELPESTAETWLLQSFRYCLGRQTYAVSDCVKHLHKYWDILPGFLQKDIQKDIQNALELDHAGADMDVKQWKKVLKLKIKDKP